MDTWTFEAERSEPRLDDLKRRIALSKQTQTRWDYITGILQTWRASFRPVPAMAMATIACILLLIPFIQMQTPVSKPNPSLANQGILAKPTLTAVAVKPTPAGAAVAVKSNPASGEKNTEKSKKVTDVKQRDQLFAEALQAGQVNRSAIGIDPANNGMTDNSTGFVPTADVYSTHYSNVRNQPSVMMDRNIKGQTVRLGN